MTQWQSTVGTQTDTGKPQWFTNGELEYLQIVDGITGTSDSQDCGYTFDDMGRLASMANGPSGSCLWAQSYSFDPFGNVAKTASAGTSFSASFNLYNQIASVGGVVGEYDADGNLLNDPTQGTTYVNKFDPDGRPETFEGVSVTYDALDRAVEAGSQEFAYAPDGTRIAVMNGQTLVRADIPLPGGAEAVYGPSGLSYYRHADWLGSARLSSTPSQTLAAATAYAPYGEEETASGAGYRSVTGKTQDIANGQAGTDPNGSYDFPAREYAPTQSRWWSPDPAGLAAVDPEYPQTWNRYAYACDPLGMTDQSGAASPCTVDVGVTQQGELPPVSLSAIENRVNQIFAATPASNGGITQVDFSLGGGAQFGLEEMSAYINGTPSPRVKLGGFIPGIGEPAKLFLVTAQSWGEGWARQPGASPFNLAAIAGTTAAHELVHEISGGSITDTTFPGQNLMGIDTAPPSETLATYNDEVSTTPTGYSKLSQAAADALYNDCINAKLKPPEGGGGGGGGLNVGGFDSWWFWTMELINSQPPPAPARAPCPNGDCRQ